MQYNVEFEMKSGEDFIGVFIGMFWNRPFSAIITSAPQAKFLSFFQSENRGNDQDLGCFFRIFLTSFQ